VLLFKIYKKKINIEYHVMGLFGGKIQIYSGIQKRGVWWQAKQMEKHQTLKGFLISASDPHSE